MKDIFRDIDVDKLTRMYYNDLPIRWIAEELGVSYSKCRRLIKVLGLPRRVQTIVRSKAPPIFAGDVKRMMDEGLTDTEIAERFGVSVEVAEALVDIQEMKIRLEEEGELDDDDGIEKRWN